MPVYDNRPGLGIGPGRFQRALLTPDDAPTIASVTPNAGPTAGGTAVTITGTNFVADGSPTGGVVVAFGDIKATSVVVVNSTTITCVTPAVANAGAADIVVVIGQRTARLAGAFTFVVGAVTEVSPSYGPIIGGTPVLISGFNLVAGSTVSFGGTAATSVVFIDSEHIRCTSPNHATGVVDVVVTEPGLATATKRNGFQYTLLNRGADIRRNPGINIRDVLNSAPNTCSLTIDGRAPMPQVGQKFEVRDEADNQRLLFGGIAQTVEQIYEELTSQWAWNVSLIDFTWLLNKRRPFGTYVNVSVSVIVKDMVKRFSTGFTTAHVQTNLAKVTIKFDGSDDFATCLNQLADAIGGGHWYVDYAQDLHFFHIAPAADSLPPSLMPDVSGGHITLAETATPSTAGVLFKPGYYLLRHSFLYSDGTESSVKAVSNLAFLSGTNVLAISTLPLGLDPGGGITCVARRIYYNRLVTGVPGGDPLDLIQGFCQVNDNTTTAFTTWFGAQGASLPVVVALGVIITYPTPSVATPDGFQLLSNNAAAINLTGTIPNGTYGISPLVAAPADGTQLTDDLHLVIASSSTGSNGSLTWGFLPGDVIRLKFTVVNASGETVMSTPGLVYTQLAGPYPNSTTTPLYFAPTVMPAGGQFFAAYASITRAGAPAPLDGSEYHRLVAARSAGTDPIVPLLLRAGQSFVFWSPLSVWQTLTLAPTTSTARNSITSWVGYNGVTQLPSSGPFPASGGTVAYFATPALAALLEAAAANAALRPPVKSFNGHPVGPAAAPVASADTLATGLTSVGYSQGGSLQFKVATLYRDGSVSYPSPASPTLTIPSVYGSVLRGFNLLSIPTSPAIGSVDVVARFVYFCWGMSTNPNYSQTTTPVLGLVWPIPAKEPDWASLVGDEVLVINDNTTTTLAAFSLGELGSTVVNANIYLGAFVGRGNRPVDNNNLQAVSVDPVPMWPNADGPSLEDDLPPGDLTDTNPDLLRDAEGGQAFTVSTDLSQVRNRVIVIGAASVTTATANIGDLQIPVADITAFSPAGGTLKYDDAASGDLVQLKYTGITGAVGAPFVTLAASLQHVIAQGVEIANYYQADDVASQKYLAKIELDTNGLATDGIHEFVIVDTSMKAMFQLYMRAHAELERYSMPIITVRYSTRDPLTRSGQTVHVDMTNPPCHGDFLIQDVTIDQVHDASDNLTPRYTAVAASTRFELDDLLLKIVQNQADAPSAAGLVQSAITSALAAIPATSSSGGAAVDISQLTRNISLAFMHESNSVGNLTGAISTAPGVSGAGSATFVDARGPWSRLTTQALAGGTAAAVTQTTTNVRAEFDPEMLIHFRLNDVTSIRFWAGFWTNNITDADVAVRQGFGVRYSTVAGDTGFRLVTFDGSQVLGGTVGVLNANTEYVLRIQASGGGALFTVTLVDVVAATQVSGSLSIPAGVKGQALFLGQARVMPQAASARILDVLRWATAFGPAVVPIT